VSGTPPPALIAAALGLAALLFLAETAIAVLLLAVSSLSRVGIRRLAAEDRRLGFLEDVRSGQSSRRISLHAARETCLLGASVSLALAARGSGMRHPWLLGVAGGTVLGTLLLEGVAARVLALRAPRAAIRATAFLAAPIHALFYPAAKPMERLVRRFTTGSAGGSETEEDEQEVDAFLEVGEREGILEAGESRMVRGIVDLGDTRVREIMTPRTDIAALSADGTVAEARKVLLRTGHSRLPVYRGTVDNVVGVLDVRDVLKASDEGADARAVTAFLRPAFFVPETQFTADLLTQMRTRTRMAMVVDEYGGLAGLVTLEDLLEEIVGEIREEHEPEEPRVEAEPEGSWLVSGLVHVDEVEPLFDVSIGERDFDTVGGLVVAALGRVPPPGERLEAHGLAIEVLEADRRRVYRVRLRKAAPPEGAAGETA
jgi:CBS domain containing-hemolysin-like protein